MPIMSWLDALIDGMRRMTYRLLPWSPFGLVTSLGPFSRVGSIGNVVICSGLVVTSVVVGVADEPFAVATLLPTALMEAVFVRIAIRAWRGDFDALPEDDV